MDDISQFQKLKIYQLRMRITLIISTVIVLLVSSCQSSYRITKEQKTLIMEVDSLKPMRVFKIANLSDSLLLRRKSTNIKVDPNDIVLKTFVKRLYATVRDSMSLGVGIAAPQVGILKNIIWVQRFDKDNLPFEVYLNPTILEYSKKKQPCLEGCLSIPERRDTTYTRSENILIEYDRMDKSHITEEVKGFTAVISQHEIDHLNGILYLDHLKEEVSQSKE